jgi:hypothetical protein
MLMQGSLAAMVDKVKPPPWAWWRTAIRCDKKVQNWVYREGAKDVKKCLKKLPGSIDAHLSSSRSSRLRGVRTPIGQCL